MAAQEVVENYFKSITTGDWEVFVDDDIKYVFNDVNRVMVGKDVYVQRAGQFYGFTSSCSMHHIVASGQDVALIANYIVRSPNGASREFSVAEFYTVKKDKIVAVSIFFDLESFGVFMGKRVE